MTVPSDHPSVDVIDTPAEIWGIDLVPAGCPNCRQAFLIPQSLQNRLCPACAQGQLQSQPALLRREPPEMILPNQLQAAHLEQAVAGFIKGVWLTPDDFIAQNLTQRLRLVYWPMWLVDSHLDGNWLAEVGYNYQVQSSQETYQNSTWQSQAVVETRVRWEPRLGELHRSYSNTPAPAVSSHNKLVQQIGPYPVEKARPYDAQYVRQAIVHVPDLYPENAWPYARTKVERLAADEIACAAAGQHIRNLKLETQSSDFHWTQLLLPIYTSYYLDDDGQVQLVWVNGYTGAINGRRMSSQKKGWRWAGITAAVAALVFLISLVLTLTGAAVPALSAIGTLGILFAILVGLCALIPAIWPWQWNRRQQPEKVTSK